MFWSYFKRFALVAVGIWFVLEVMDSEWLAQLVLFFVIIATLAGLATIVEGWKEQAGTLARLEEKLDRLFKEQDGETPNDRDASGPNKL